MKVTTLLMLVLCLQLTMFANGQEKITVVARNTVWSKALSAVEKASDYRFVYSSDIAAADRVFRAFKDARSGTKLTTRFY